MYTIVNYDKGTVQHDLQIPKLLYHAEYFAGKILNCVDPHLLLMVNVCFPPEELLNNVAVAFPARYIQRRSSLLYM